MMNQHPARTGLLLCGLAALAGTIAVQAGAQPRRGPAYSYESGKDIYENVCQGCHMPGGLGAQGAGIYPALAGNRKLQAPLYPVLVILRGQKAMPSFSALSDEQVTQVTNYIRTGFGNSFANPVTLDQVKGLRARAVQQTMQRPG